MNKRLFISFLVFFLAIVFLIYKASHGTLFTVITPSELADRLNSAALSRIRVGGRVISEGISYQLEPEVRLSFYITTPGIDDGKKIRVEYRGEKPDIFTAGRDVIIDGEYRDGVLYAARLMTSCPSKYDSKTIQEYRDSN